MNKIRDGDDNTHKDFPTSAHGHKCIGPCYFPNTRIIHPLTLDYINDVKYNFCPTNQYIDPETSGSHKRMVYYDKCIIPTASTTLVDERLQNELISPMFRFSNEYFVKFYYKIQNLENLLKWLDQNKEYPYKTKERVFNSGMVVYGNEVNIIDHRMINYINEVMIYNLPLIYKKLRPYIKIESNKISLTKPDNVTININANINSTDTIDIDTNLKTYEYNTDDSYTIYNIRKYIKDKFLGLDNIHQFMSKLIRYYKEKMTSSKIINTMITYMIEHCIKRILTTLESKE